MAFYDSMRRSVLDASQEMYAKHPPRPDVSCMGVVRPARGARLPDSIL